MAAHVTRPVVRILHGVPTPDHDQLAVEEPLEIRIGSDDRYQPMAVTMRTPGADDDVALAAGFCLTEGVIRHPDELEHIEPCALADYGNIVNVRLHPQALARRSRDIEAATRQMYVASSCGLCGKASIDRVRMQLPDPPAPCTLDPTLWQSLPSRMRNAQRTFNATGGLHAAAVFTPQGELLTVYEDIGRHNAVDKAIGSLLLRDRWPMERGILCVSGRAGFEIVQKAAMARFSVVVAVGAPSSLAVDFAVSTGLTLVGFVRDGRMNLYTP